MYAALGMKTLAIFGLSNDGACQCGNGEGCAPGKHPVWTAWQRKASVDLAATRALFRGHTGNIAVYCDNRLALIDLDGPAGRESVVQLGELTPTLTAETGSGGVHMIYRLQAWQDPSKISDRRVLPGLDVKVRGYFVAAPSLHVSGRRYRWTTAIEPAPLPDHVYAQIRKPEPTPRIVTPAIGGSATMRRLRAYVAAMPAAVSGQGGHAATFAVARRVACLPWAEGMELLEEYNDRCKPAWTRAELEHKLRSAQEQGEFIGIVDRPRVEPIRPGVEVPDQSWMAALKYVTRKDGGAQLARGGHNQVALLEHDPVWAGRIRLDEFAGRIEINSPPWIQYDVAAAGWHAWTDTDAKLLQQWYQWAHELDVSVAACHEAIAVVGRKHAYHPVRQWLAAVAWDGQQRLSGWLARYLGADDSEYTRSVGAWWLISAVARVHDPGCKADHMLILEGPQGIGKSTALRILAGDAWFNDTPLDLTSKDAYQALAGRWIVEFAELASMRRTEAEKIKAFCSSPSDHYRASYERVAKTHPRQCVFAGTTNASEYLQDATGNRRFWPVETRRLDLEALRRDRNQLWAEALDAYRSGAKWYPDHSVSVALLASEQEKRMVSDDWEPKIAEWVKDRNRVTTGEILTGCLNVPTSQLGSRGAGDQKRVANCLTRLGFQRVRQQRSGLRVVEYVRAEA